ncbi:DUF1648 domain-containing protein [Brevibacterium sp. ZH18]|uniref:DUF1648 domain-containing protein n=1 Tax=Brevibacterium sp. ZH18 TaxID=2927784 RepID=UPI001F607699|nr:DUF1648 domain-containing protein [Brevibacterium sp. ZH18]
MTSSSAPRQNPLEATAALVFATVSILVFIGASIWFWTQAPETVASHFDASGQPDDWSSKAGMMAVLVPLGIGFPLIFSIRWIWEKLPTAIINFPNKDYWLERGEHAYLYDCLMQFLRTLGGSLALLFTTILVMILREGRGASMPTGMSFVPTVFFLVIAGLATWRTYRQLKP